MPDLTDDDPVLLILTELRLLNRTLKAVAQDVQAIHTAADKQASELWQQKIAEMYRRK